MTIYRTVRSHAWDPNVTDTTSFDIIETWFEGPYKYVSVNGEKARKYLNI